MKSVFLSLLFFLVTTQSSWAKQVIAFHADGTCTVLDRDNKVNPSMDGTTNDKSTACVVNVDGKNVTYDKVTKYSSKPASKKASEEE